MASEAEVPGLQADSRDSDSEELRLAYQAAIALWTYEGSTIWSKFNAMLLANSVLAAIIGFSVGSGPQVLPRVTSCLGLVLCLVWFALTKRGFDQYIYWIFAARELESRLGDQVVVISRGGAFADGDMVSVSLENGPRNLQMSWFSRRLTASLASYLAIVVFAVMYAALLFVSIAGLGQK